MKIRKYNYGKWTPARFYSFIKGNLRHASLKWPPRNEVKKQAWVRRGKYKCAGYERTAHVVHVTKLINGKRKPNIFIDHIVPIINPKKGFEGWDKVIDSMFCEADNLQVLCSECHDRKTNDEGHKFKT